MTHNLCRATEGRGGEEKMKSGLCYSVHGLDLEAGLAAFDRKVGGV